MRGTRRSWSSILLIIILLSAKNAKKKLKKQIVFFVSFLSLVKFQLGGSAPPPLACVYATSEENKKGVRKFSARFLSFSNEISTVQKIVLSSSRGQGNFRGLEASRPRPRTSKCVLEANDALKDSTSDNNKQFIIHFWVYQPKPPFCKFFLIEPQIDHFHVELSYFKPTSILSLLKINFFSTKLMNLILAYLETWQTSF